MLFPKTLSFRIILAQFYLSQSACWSQNASTVYGLSNGTSGSALNQLNISVGIQIVDNDTLYITDSNNQRIIIVNLNYPNISFALGAGYGNLTSQMSYPSNIFVTQTFIYVVDKGNYRIIKWLKNRTNPTVAAGITGTSGGPSSNITIGSCFYIFVDKNDSLYVSDTYNHRVLRFPSNSSSGTIGVVIAGNGTGGSSANQFNRPNGIFLTDNGTLYIADIYNNRIQMWRPGASSGERVAGDGTIGSNATQLYYPNSVFVDFTGTMYITELKNSRVTRWAANSNYGVCIAACSKTAGNKPNQLNSPQALPFDSKGSLYVSDQSNSRIQKFEITDECSKCIRLLNTYACYILQNIVDTSATTVTSSLLSTSRRSNCSLLFSPKFCRYQSDDHNNSNRRVDCCIITSFDRLETKLFVFFSNNIFRY